MYYILHTMITESIQNVISVNKALQSENEFLKSELRSLKNEISELKRMIFGQKSERYVSADNQLALSNDWGGTEDENKFDDHQTIVYDRKNPKKRVSGREAIPEHIPRKVTLLEPDVDTSDMEKISEKITEQLEYKPPEFYVTQFVRPVYADKSTGVRKIHCAELPSLCIDKGKAGPTLVAHTLVAKCEDHLPLDRVLKQVRRDCGMELPKSSTGDWFTAGCVWVGALVRRMEEIMLSASYLQIDESYLKVMLQPTAGKSSQGYMWVRHAPEFKITVFNFDKKQNTKVAQQLIPESYAGTVQSDGLSVYDFLSDRKGVEHAGCNGHARRYFEKSLGNDKARSEHGMLVFQKIFAVEKEAKDKNLTPEERLRLRKEKTAPVMAEFKKWLDAEVLIVAPKGKIGKAIYYTWNRWAELTLFLKDGNIEISNNLIENIIRPLAIGRRNWLFAGSPQGAARLASAYSIILTCKLNGVNSFKYLCDVLQKLPLRKNNNIDDLLPWNWVEPMPEN